MWQEARKQEKKLRGIMIDFKKRAERRQAYYAKMKMDPHQLMRIYGQKCKLHILSENSKVTDTDGQLVPWQGDPEVFIDRFDARSHLDYIPNVTKKEEEDEEKEKTQRKCNYESYRTLVQIDATGASEEQYLKQLGIEEYYGRKQAEKNEEIKAKSKANAKIHYQYKDSTEDKDSDIGNSDNDSDGDESDSDLSDIDINVNVIELSDEQKNHLDALSTQYGIGYGQYCKQLLLEKREFEYVKRLEEEEEERSKMPGRRGKAARRDLRMKQKTLRGSPLSFAMKENIEGEGHESKHANESSSDSEQSRSRSPANDGKIEFITEFGGGGDDVDVDVKRDRKNSSTKHTESPSTSSRHNVKSKRHHSKSSTSCRSRSRSRDSKRRSSHRDDGERRRNRSRSRSRSRRKSDSRRQSRSRSRSSRRDYRSSKRRSRSRSRSRSKSRDRRRSRSRTRSKERIRKRSHSPHESISKMLGTDKPKESSTTQVDKSKLSARDKMKLRMQNMLNKQIKQDKKNQQKKQEKKELEAEERDNKIYEMSKILKSRERDKKFRRSPSPRSSGRLPSYDASKFAYEPRRSRSRSP